MPSVTTQESKMKKHLLMAGAVVAALAIPLAANPQSGAATGAVGGAVGGAIVGGPVGAVVGGVGGAIIGGISDDRRAGFRTYVVQEKRSSYKDKLLNGEIFYTLEEGKVIIESWRRHYN